MTNRTLAEFGKQKKHAMTQGSHSDNEIKRARKGTGFVHISEVPLSGGEGDDEEDVDRNREKAVRPDPW